MYTYDLDDLHAAKGEIRINSVILIIMLLYSSLYQYSKSHCKFKFNMV